MAPLCYDKTFKNAFKLMMYSMEKSMHMIYIIFNFCFNISDKYLSSMYLLDVY